MEIVHIISLFAVPLVAYGKYKVQSNAHLYLFILNDHYKK